MFAHIRFFFHGLPLDAPDKDLGQGRRPEGTDIVSLWGRVEANPPPQGRDRKKSLIPRTRAKILGGKVEAKIRIFLLKTNHKHMGRGWEC